jgi:hypothetical protein
MSVFRLESWLKYMLVRYSLFWLFEIVFLSEEKTEKGHNVAFGSASSRAWESPPNKLVLN